MDVFQSHPGDIGGRAEMQQCNLGAFIAGAADLEMHPNRFRDDRGAILAPALTA